MLVVLEDLVHGRPEETTDQSVCSERCLLHVHADDPNPLSTVSQKLKRIGDRDRIRRGIGRYRRYGDDDTQRIAHREAG